MKNFFKNFLKRRTPITSGFIAYRSPDPLNPYRMHLRVEPDGTGILVINASKILHLNQTATEIVKYMLEGKDETETAKIMKSRYRGVSKKRIVEDYLSIKDKIFTLAETDEICPITYLGFERIEPFSTPVTAPYRMDLALTYRCNVNCTHCYVIRDKNYPELSTEEWKKIIKRLYEIGIPHVVFTGGEPTLRDDLVELVEYAEETGLVTGLLTNGVMLCDKKFVKKLESAGLDHVQITIESHIPEVHNKMVRAESFEKTLQGIKNALKTTIYTITNTTLTKLNAPYIEDTIEFLHTLGVRVFACNGLIYTAPKRQRFGFKETELKPILEKIRNKAAELNMRFIWYTPTQYCNLNPVELELGPKTCTAAKYNMCIEPNGDVIPCQGYYETMGNILKDPWENIWNSKVAVSLRNREWIEEKCRECTLLPLCGGGCPLYAKVHGFVCPDSKSNPV